MITTTEVDEGSSSQGGVLCNDAFRLHCFLHKSHVRGYAR